MSRMMFNYRLFQILLILPALIAAGCKSNGMVAQAKRDGTLIRAEGQAALPLDQIQPQPVLPQSLETADTTPAPLEAIELFARARGALLRDQPHTAIMLLNRALELDPESSELHYMLGQALWAAELGEQRIVDAFERAAAIRPDHVDVHLQLGRLRLHQGDLEHAILHLRTARLTSGYYSREDAAALVDLLLARALDQAGYDRAALELYTHLVRRLQRPGLSMTAHPELAFLLERPEVLHVAIAEICQRNGAHGAALAAYESAVHYDPMNFDIQARIVRTLLAMNRRGDATRSATEVVVRFHASLESLALLRDTYRAVGREHVMLRDLTALYEQRPDDHELLFALADALQERGQRDQAADLLRQAMLRSGGDIQVVRRLFALHDSADDTVAAAAVLMEATALNPHAIRELSALWDTLLRPSRTNRLRVDTLRKMSVSDEAEPVRLFWVSRIAELWHRDMLARNALEEAVAHRPLFAPAYRVLVGSIWMREDLDEQQKTHASEELVQQADKQGHPEFAAELRGLILLNQGHTGQAVTALFEAMRLGNQWPELYLTYAGALRAMNQEARAEQTLWKLLKRWPEFEEVYGALFGLYLERRSPNQAMQVLDQWLTTHPNSIQARLVQVGIYLQARRPQAAEEIVLHLFQTYPEDPQVLAALQGVLTQTGRVPRLIELLEQERAQRPENRAAVERLIDVYASHDRRADALRVLDATRQAVAADPDLLYYVAHLYSRLDRKQTMEEVLEEVVRLDPTHAPASNDLGYTWVDDGRNLGRAEELIRAAVEAEPDNQAFLDSLGWVLYKRGKFEEARKYLEQAVGPAARPDPIILDHLGDVLWRLGETEQAVQQWQRARQRLREMSSERPDHRELSVQLQRKLRQVEQGRDVEVAPTVETAAAGGE